MNLLSFSDSESRFFIEKTVRDLIVAKGTAEAAREIGSALGSYTIFDLQYIGGGIQREVGKLPNPYRRCYQPFSSDLLNQYHAFMTKYRIGGFADTRIKDPELWHIYWDITPAQCFVKHRSPHDPFPQLEHPMTKLFYRLVYGYVMLIEGGYGHPVGMPFPGGAVIRREGNHVLCPIRDKEKDFPTALCNFCPAEQDSEYR
ncbi:DUF2115 family protein [Methanorbis rubei]|uniref:UPF0305 protein McpCs1_13640 n=1 Tax=Methanorbis rubei TaxID=3028300 RepID=A0AAE4SBW0_9EURY|nr:hypothetical protein [Methanocorpusculaceae archaeon Cs1]